MTFLQHWKKATAAIWSYVPGLMFLVSYRDQPVVLGGRFPEPSAPFVNDNEKLHVARSP